MDLIQAAWMIRDLGQPVSSIDLEEDSIIAGGWDGSLKMWNGDGDILWSTQCEDRIEAILRIDELVVVTSGLHVTCVKSGDILWSNPLEGSADLLAFHNNRIIATSSVYDIEHGDFMESALWQFSLDGELLEVTRMDERPWFLHSGKNLILALGRPKCGLMVDGKHRELPSSSPVMCGLAGRENILLGHADGTISTYSGEEICKEHSSIESLTCIEEGFVAALESGTLVARALNSDQLWEADGAQVTTHVAGFDDLHWCGRWGSVRGNLEVRSNSGELMTSAETSRPRVSDFSENRIGFGFEDGQILIWERELFNRRSKQEKVEENSRNSALAAKLRSLRK
tara:strand:+ start:241 stop:1263 length:1023 start_codon:yes stop_codon:yes gene_type:complete